jgi:hypothetical protein
MGRYLTLAMNVGRDEERLASKPAVSPMLSGAARAAPQAAQRVRQNPFGQTDAAIVVRLPTSDNAAPVAACGSPLCAGCYDVGDGRKIHPPRCGEEWLLRLETKCRIQ